MIATTEPLARNVFSSSRSAEPLELKRVAWSELKPHVDVFEGSGEARTGLLVANNPINEIDPLGLKTCWKYVTMTSFEDEKGAFGDKLKKGDIAVGHTGKKQQPDPAKPKDKNWVLPYGTKVNVYPKKSPAFEGTVKDVGAYDKKHPDKAGPSDWIDIWDPEKSKKNQSDEGWTSIEVDDCDKCPPGWIGD